MGRGPFCPCGWPGCCPGCWPGACAGLCGLFGWCGPEACGPAGPACAGPCGPAGGRTVVFASSLPRGVPMAGLGLPASAGFCGPACSGFSCAASGAGFCSGFCAGEPPGNGLNAWVGWSSLGTGPSARFGVGALLPGACAGVCGPEPLSELLGGVGFSDGRPLPLFGSGADELLLPSSGVGLLIASFFALTV